MMRPRHTAAALLALAMLAAPLLSACGGAAPSVEAPKAAAPSAAPPPALESVAGKSSSAEGALAAVDSAERAIDQALGPAPVGTTLAQSTGQAVAPIAPPPPAAAPEPPPPPPPPAPPATGVRAKGSVRERDVAPSPRAAPAAESCGTACSALASMERAADHLCGITGAADERCAGARARVNNASARVHAVCSCGRESAP